MKKGTEDLPQLVYTVAETAKILKVNNDAVYELIRQGKLKALRLGCLKIRKLEIERFLAQQEWEDNQA